MNHSALASTIMSDTRPNAVSHDECNFTQPTRGGEMASPNAWMRKIFSANAVALMREEVTFARAVLAGPVLKNRKNTAPNTAHHAYGNGSQSIASVHGNASRMAKPDTRKYAPGKRGRSLSPSQPPANVERMPATTTMAPKVVFTSVSSLVAVTLDSEGLLAWVQRLEVGRAQAVMLRMLVPVHAVLVKPPHTEFVEQFRETEPPRLGSL